MTLTEIRALALAETPGAGWTCWRCEQRNAGWTTTCGRCELDRITPERVLQLLDVIEKAEAMRADWGHKSVMTFVTAIEALDKEQK